MRTSKRYILLIIISLATLWGCAKSDMSTHANMPQLFVPTAFTPNGDKVNDTFKIVAKSPLTYYSITIYDNNNIVVYQDNNIETGWDGRYEGDPEPGGSYLWVINYQGEGTPVAKMSGWVELIR